MRPLPKAIALVAVLALLAGSGVFGAWMGLRSGGDTNASDQPAIAPMPSGGRDADVAPRAALTRYYDQDVTWTACGHGLQCGHLLVPLDYAHPHGRTISLRMVMRPASDPGQRVGTLLVNPGGPGAPADTLAQNAPSYFGQPLLQHFDILGLNPRGTDGSDPIDCLSNRQLDHYLAMTPVPTTPAQVRSYRHWDDAMGRGCRRRSGAIADHVSTVEAARDMDVLRAVLGEGRLDYLGFSYGTKLGTTYADLFPSRVGRFVLDGAIDPELSSRRAQLQQAGGFETALRSYVRHCVASGGCFLGGSLHAGLARIQAFLRQDRALPAGDGRTLHAGDAVYGLVMALYDRGLWTYLDQGLQQAFRGDGRTLMWLADLYSTRRAEGGYETNLLEANYDINCLDDPWSVPVDKVSSVLPAFERASPTFGAVFAWMATACSGSGFTRPVPEPPVGAPGADPIVVVGTTRDPATPYAGAKALASELDSGVLVTRDGDGHTGYHAGNACVDHAVEGYLVSGVAPRDGLSC